MQYKSRYLAVICLLLSVICISAPALAASSINKTCTDANTLQINSTYVINVAGSDTPINITKNQYCSLGCNNVSFICNGENQQNDSSIMWMTYVAGVVFMSLGIFLGIPYGKLVGEENIKPGIDTRTVVRYMFFFVGFFLVYLSFGVARGMGGVYGTSSTILGAFDVTTMVMLITMVLFLMIFVIEFVFSIIKFMGEKRTQKEWGVNEV